MAQLAHSPGFGLAHIALAQSQRLGHFFLRHGTKVELRVVLRLRPRVAFDQEFLFHVSNYEGYVATSLSFAAWPFDLAFAANVYIPFSGGGAAVDRPAFGSTGWVSGSAMCRNWICGIEAMSLKAARLLLLPPTSCQPHLFFHPFNYSA